MKPGSLGPLRVVYTTHTLSRVRPDAERVPRGRGEPDDSVPLCRKNST